MMKVSSRFFVINPIPFRRLAELLSRHYLVMTAINMYRLIRTGKKKEKTRRKSVSPSSLTGIRRSSWLICCHRNLDSSSMASLIVKKQR